MLPAESLKEVVAFFHLFHLEALLLVNSTFAALAKEQFLAGQLKYVRIECIERIGLLANVAYVYDLLIGRTLNGSTSLSRSEVAWYALYDELVLKLSNTAIECMTVRCFKSASKHLFNVLAESGASLAVSKLLRVHIAGSDDTQAVVRQILSFCKITVSS